MKSKLSFKIDNTKPLDIWILYHLISDVINLKANANNHKKVYPEAETNLADDYEELDDVASLSVYQASNEISYADCIEDTVRAVITKLDASDFQTYDKALTVLYIFLVNLLPTVNSDRVSDLKTIKCPYLNQQIVVSGNDRTILHNIDRVFLASNFQVINSGIELCVKAFQNK